MFSSIDQNFPIKFRYHFRNKLRVELWFGYFDIFCLSTYLSNCISMLYIIIIMNTEIFKMYLLRYEVDILLWPLSDTLTTINCGLTVSCWTISTHKIYRTKKRLKSKKLNVNRQWSWTPQKRDFKKTNNLKGNQRD